VGPDDVALARPGTRDVVTQDSRGRVPLGPILSRSGGDTKQSRIACFVLVPLLRDQVFFWALKLSVPWRFVSTICIDQALAKPADVTNVPLLARLWE
jgi:hypothetical protein